MRDIKFRAWDKENKKMFYDGMKFELEVIARCEGTGDETIIGFKPDFEGQVFEIMQYTGLKDKNGKEIYESDIICYNNLKKGPRSRMTVKWSQEGACYQLLAFKEDWCYELGMCYEFTLEVIGNIYENSELLEEEK